MGGANLHLSLRLLATIVLVSGATAALELPAQGRLPPAAGARCFDSLRLQTDLPFADDSRAADIVNIAGVMPPEGGIVVGFIYTTRRGELFAQVEQRRFEPFRDALARAGATQTAYVLNAEHTAGMVVGVSSQEARGLLAKLKRLHQLYPCFTHALS